MAEKFDKASLDFESQCTDKDLTGAVLRELVQHGKKHKLEKFEIPGAVTIVKEIWDPDTGLVTAAFKLKRRPLQVQKKIIFQILWKIRCDILVSFPSHLKKLRSILRF